MVTNTSQRGMNSILETGANRGAGSATKIDPAPGGGQTKTSKGAAPTAAPSLKGSVQAKC